MELLPTQMMSLALGYLQGREQGKFERITKSLLWSNSGYSGSTNRSQAEFAPGRPESRPRPEHAPGCRLLHLWQLLSN